MSYLRKKILEAVWIPNKGRTILSDACHPLTGRPFRKMEWDRPVYRPAREEIDSREFVIEASELFAAVQASREANEAVRKCRKAY